MTANEIPTHTPATIAPTLGVSQRRIQQICKFLFGKRGHYWLDDGERDKVEQFYRLRAKNREKTEEK